MRDYSSLASLVIVSLLLFSCGNPQQPEQAETVNNDLEAAYQGGELIVGTVSSPETYYLSHGKPFGLHFGLAEDFANSLGLRLRVETARDTLRLIEMLDSGLVDLIAYPFSEVGEGSGLSLFEPLGWPLRSSSTETQAALTAWYNPDKPSLLLRAQAEERTRPFVVHSPSFAPAAGKGSLSAYDQLFRTYGARNGWDWRLLAAVCCQESGFDPTATSWAGAQGLMQIMPATADRLGLARDDLFDPEKNIEAASRYLSMLYRQFDDIANPAERRLFALAAYNGGIHHIRDAQALARKAGANTGRWASVAPYVLRLQERRYWSDPVVKYGYMIGEETVEYVAAIQARYRRYCGMAAPAATKARGESQRRNRFSRTDSIVSPSDSTFGF